MCISLAFEIFDTISFLNSLLLSMTPDRERQVTQMARDRQPDVHVVLENVHDMHNVGAVMRSCDAAGVPKVHMILATEHRRSKMRMGKQTSAGARKWIDTILHETMNSCLSALDQPGTQILGTALTADAIPITEVDFTQPTIIIFGNERDGLDPETLDRIHQAVIIPQKGMVQSLNISVACAVTLYEMMRQRETAGLYNRDPMTPDQLELFEQYKEGHNRKRPGDVIIW